MDYSSPLYQDASMSSLTKLDRIQWRACRISLGAMISTHTLALEVESNITPLSCRRKFLTKCMISKIIAFNKEPVLSCLKELNNYFSNSSIIQTFKLVSDLDILKFQKHPLFVLNSFDSLFFRPEVSFLPLKKNTASNEEVSSVFSKALEDFESYSEIYTDGSKKDDSTSLSFFIPRLNIEATFRCSSQSSIFSAEAMAIRESLLFIKELNVKNKFLIISDSKSCLLALASKKSSNTNFIILQISELLFDLMESGVEVKFLWVPSHKGIPGNDKADELANSRHELDYIDFSQTLVTDIRSSFRSEIVLEWQSLWSNSPHGRDLYSLSPIVNKPPWFQSVLKPRLFITLFNRLRSSHCCVMSHLQKINIVQSDQCDCGSIQTVDHLLFSCNLISCLERSRFLRKLYIKKVFYLNIKNILKMDDLEIFEIIFDFVKNADIKF